MNTYNITIEVDDAEKTSRWCGYDEQVAIAQCFLHEAYQGARSIKVLGIVDICLDDTCKHNWEKKDDDCFWCTLCEATKDGDGGIIE